MFPLPSPMNNLSKSILKFWTTQIKNELLIRVSPTRSSLFPSDSVLLSPLFVAPQKTLYSGLFWQTAMCSKCLYLVSLSVKDEVEINGLMVCRCWEFVIFIYRFRSMSDFSLPGVIQLLFWVRIWEISIQPYVEVSPWNKSFVSDSLMCIPITGSTHSQWGGGPSDRVLEFKFVRQWLRQMNFPVASSCLGAISCVWWGLTLWSVLPFFPSCHFPSFSFLSYPAPFPLSFFFCVSNRSLFSIIPNEAEWQWSR